MKVAVLIMGTHSNPSERNTEAFIDTVIKYQNENRDKLKNDYDFYVYRASKYDDNSSISETIKDDRYPNLWNIEINEDEGVYRTFEKTYYAFECVSGYDLYVRINTSLFLNIDLLDAVADQLDTMCVYCNAVNALIFGDTDYINDIYPRGDMMIFGEYMRKCVLSEGRKYLYCDTDLNYRIHVDHVDDCLFGVCMKNEMGKSYCNHIKMLRYNYIPYYKFTDIKDIDVYSIGSRLKTVPPNVNYSGYSWDDNEYRKIDVEKFKYIKEYLNNHKVDYSSVKLNDLISEGKNSRKIACVNYVNVAIDDLRKYLLLK